MRRLASLFFLLASVVSAQQQQPPSGYIPPYSVVAKNPSGQFVFLSTSSAGNLLMTAPGTSQAPGQTPPTGYVQPIGLLGQGSDGKWHFLQTDSYGNLQVNGSAGAPGQPNYFTDLFNRTGANLGAGYQDYTNSWATTAGVTGVSVGSATGTNTTNYNVSAFNAVAAGPTQNVTVVVNPNSTFYTGAEARISGTQQSAENGYACIESSSQLFMVKRVAMTPSNGGTQTVLLGPTNVTTTSADVINTRIVGNTVSCNWNRTGATMEYNDTTGGGSGPITSGLPGIIMDGHSTSTVPSIISFTVENPAAAPGATVHVVADGDSITEGAAGFSRWTDYLSFPSGTVASVANVAVDGKGLCTGRPAGGVNGGGSAGTIETMLVTGISVIDPLYVSGITNIAVLGPTVNDMSAGTLSASAEYACLTTYVANRHAAGWKVVVTPALSNSSNDTVMQQYNQLIAANSAGADAVVYLPQSMVGTHAYSNATFFVDGVHPTEFARVSIIAPNESAAINSLL